MKKQVWVIDDESVFHLIFSTLARKAVASATVETFLYAEEALQKLEKDADLPDIIFLDLNMPIMNGWLFLEEFEKVKASLARIPRIVILTSSNDPKDRSRAAAFATVTDYVLKPIQLEYLVTALA